MVDNYNISSLFVDYARSNPDKTAFVQPVEYNSKEVLKENIITYREFLAKVAQYRKGLTLAGFKKGDKIIILCHINVEFYAFMMAMFTKGMVAVFLDPGIGIKKILTAITDSRSQGIVSMNRIMRLWPIIPPLWKIKRFSVDKCPIGVSSLNTLKSDTVEEFEVESLKADDHVLITFTSGSTGRSKGADRNAENVYNQLQLIKNNWVCDEDQIDFPIFLMFGFMNLLYGITTVLPAAEYQNIGNISPEVIVKQMQKWKVTRMSGSYTFNNKLADYLQKNNIEIKTLKNIVLGGTPVTKEFCHKLKDVYPEAKSLMTYGSTEVAPISFCPLDDLIETQAMGSFVGKPCKELEVAIVNLPEVYQGDIENYKLPQGEWGEVLIAGPHVVKKYFENEKADHENKIKDSQGRIWHRSGDTGYFDQNENLILTGRLSELIFHQGHKIHPYIVEFEIDAIEAINRSAIIEKKGKVYLCYDAPRSLNHESIQQILAKHNLAEAKIAQVDKIPLDDRHNSKINRIKLKGMI